MKKKWILLIPLIAAALQLDAQIKVGFRAGVTSNSFRPEDKVRLLVTQGKMAEDLQRAAEAEFRYQEAKTATVITGTSYSGPIYSPAFTPSYIEQLRLATLNREYYESDRSTVGFTAGGYGSYQILPFLTGRMELTYAMAGGTLDSYSLGGIIRRNVRLVTHNLEIPILVELGIPSMSEAKVQPKFRIGGFYGLNLGAQEKYETVISSSFGSQGERQSSNVSSALASNYGGYVVGLGVDIQSISIELRYNQNLTTMNSSAAQTSSLQYTLPNYLGQLRTSAFSINVSMPLFEF
ncbi:MAG: outer membrane beta-barrel protein [Bacteroidota bacterium]